MNKARTFSILANNLQYTIKVEDGNYKVQNRVMVVIDGKLSDFIKTLQDIEKSHPDAEISEEDLDFSNDVAHFVTWWVELDEKNPLMKDILATAISAEETHLRNDKATLARIKKERPELFK